MIKTNLENVKNKINQALSMRKERMITCDSVELVAVTKTHSADVVKEALAAGLDVFGENKVQEAEGKIPLVNAGSWHLIGHLQTNKVKKAVELFSLIYSVDSVRLIEAIDKEAKKQDKVQDILLQVNIADEKSKFGLLKSQVSDVWQATDVSQNIRLRGLMVIAPEAPNPEDIRDVFKQGYDCFCDLKQKNSNDINILSMGMSGDYQVAIEEGANNIRLGSVLFGRRDYAI